MVSITPHNGRERIIPLNNPVMLNTSAYWDRLDGLVDLWLHSFFPYYSDLNQSACMPILNKLQKNARTALVIEGYLT